jgi:tRNA nucleotidyltransferase (CCA-adding enzyme)
MPDYMYLLESRLSPEQRAVLERVQELARAQSANVYLTGGAIRDLISGMPIRDLDFTVEGSPFKIVRELEKGGARAIYEDERLRHIEIIFAGDVDGSISAARDDFYDRPGAKPEIRWSTVMEDLRRRDFSVNAIAISLNPNSRGLLLDPTNGLADLERREVRALSIHAFTNQPVRLMRILRYAARMGFKMESRTSEWFELAIARNLHENLDGVQVGWEVHHLGREDNPVATLRLWETNNLLAGIHPQLAKRRPDYERLTKLAHVREAMLASGVRARLFAPVTHFLLGRLKAREAAAALRHLELRADESQEIAHLIPEAEKAVKILKSPKMKAPKDAYLYLSQLRPDLLAFIQVEYPNPKALNQIRNYLQRWRPLRQALPVAELDALGIARGPKFDKILENLFEAQLRGRGRLPLDRTKLLRQLAGIKEEVKVEKKGKAKTVGATAADLKEHAKHRPAHGGSFGSGGGQRPPGKPSRSSTSPFGKSQSHHKPMPPPAKTGKAARKGR